MTLLLELSGKAKWLKMQGACVDQTAISLAHSRASVIFPFD